MVQLIASVIFERFNVHLATKGIHKVLLIGVMQLVNKHLEF